MDKERKFTYLSKENVDKVEKVKKMYATTFSGALNLILTQHKSK